MKRKDDKKIIGLILENIFTDFSKELIQSVSEAIPSDKNIRLIVLAGKYDGDEVPVDEARRTYLMLYNSVFMLENICDFDGLIIHLGSMNHEKKERIKNNYLDRIWKVPKVFIASDLGDACQLR